MKRTILICLAALGITAARAEVPRPDPSKPEALYLGYVKPTAPLELKPAAAPGDTVMITPVTYVATGVLKSEVKEHGLFGLYIPSHRPLPAGTPVFASPIAEAVRGVVPYRGLMWCAIDGEMTAADQPQSFVSVCFPKVMNHTIFIAAGPNALPNNLNGNGANPANDPEVEVKPVPLTPPLKISLQFAGWDNERANFRVYVEQPGHFDMLHTPVLAKELLLRPHIALDPAGLAHLSVFGTELAVSRDADGKGARIAVVRTAEADVAAPPAQP